MLLQLGQMPQDSSAAALAREMLQDRENLVRANAASRSDVDQKNWLPWLLGLDFSRLDPGRAPAQASAFVFDNLRAHFRPSPLPD